MLLGLVTVTLVARRSLWNYAFGLPMVALYFFIFLDAKLYSDALLQLVFAAAQAHGIVQWQRAARQAAGGDEAVPVGWLDPRARIGWAAATIGLSLGWGLVMARFTDAALPVADALIAGLSIAAQVLQARRRVECWWLWLAVNALAMLVYPQRGLYLTAALYAVFFGLALYGWREWRRAAGPDGRAVAA